MGYKDHYFADSAIGPLVLDGATIGELEDIAGQIDGQMSIQKAEELSGRILAITKRFSSTAEIKQALAGSNDPDPNDMRGDELRLHYKIGGH